jgi:hypothetical protein
MRATHLPMRIDESLTVVRKLERLVHLLLEGRALRLGLLGHGPTSHVAATAPALVCVIMCNTLQRRPNKAERSLHDIAQRRPIPGYLVCVCVYLYF